MPPPPPPSPPTPPPPSPLPPTTEVDVTGYNVDKPALNVMHISAASHSRDGCDEESQRRISRISVFNRFTRSQLDPFTYSSPQPNIHCVLVPKETNAFDFSTLTPPTTTTTTTTSSRMQRGCERERPLRIMRLSRISFRLTVIVVVVVVARQSRS